MVKLADARDLKSLGHYVHTGSIPVFGTKGYRMADNGVIHAIAHCRNCDWTEEDVNIALKKGREHSKKTNILDVVYFVRQVLGEVGDYMRQI